MRRILLGFVLLLWFTRIADPVLHSLAHDHHEHCAEQDLHLHEGDDSCKWTDPAYLLGLQPVSIGWELLPPASWRSDPMARVASTKNSDSEAIALRGPPVS
jgi:hypothetical protein